MARSLGEESVTLYKEMGHRHGTAEALAAFGKVMAAQGDYAAARSLYEESLAISSGLGEQWVIAVSLLGLGKVVAAQGEPAWAAQLWGAAEALRETLQVPIRPVERAGYEQAVDEARAQLGEKNFAARWTQGRTMTLEQALAAQGQGVVPVSMTTPTPSTAHPAGLTAREVEVLRLVARGLTDLQIAEQLTLSPRTVHAHISSIYGKLGVSSRSMATRYAIEHNLA
jgi:DNA-binding CsgD family transcriptional regulator